MQYNKFPQCYNGNRTLLRTVLQFITATLLKKETLAQAISCGFCEISKTTFYYRTLPVAASELNLFIVEFKQITK